MTNVHLGISSQILDEGNHPSKTESSLRILPGPQAALLQDHRVHFTTFFTIPEGHHPRGATLSEAGLRAQHDKHVMLVTFFIPIETKSGLTVSQELFQLMDHIASCKQLQACTAPKCLAF